MCRKDVLAVFDRIQQRRSLSFRIGDFVSVVFILHDGSKKRSQHFDGIVVRIHNKTLASCMVAVYRPTMGGCLKVFPLQSENVYSITVKRSSRVRRSRLNYIVGKVGKMARLPVAKLFSTKLEHE